ncbi:MAG TPA: DUF4350 domain-containing protein [Candidatus Dormibacteraeota bacterium]|nr:DUF4350 domain-containing protein [Candidatus Dormibacteraeota bacterium]
MKGARGWIVVTVVAVLVAAAAYFGQPHQDSPEHSSTSDAANGTSAARLFAQAMGHPTDQMVGTFALPANDGLLLVFTPTSPFTADEARRTASWVNSGGVLIYAAESGDAELDQALGIARLNGMAQSNTQAANPVLPGVTQVAGGDFSTPLDPTSEQVPVLRSPDGPALAYLQRIGSGTVVVLADPLVLCNGYLDKQTNGRLLADLFGLVGPSGSVSFDEYHHGLVLSDLAPQAWLLTPWGAALLWLIVAGFVGLVLRGRGFGPVIPRPAEAARAEVEWAVAVGELLRRSGARAVTLGLLATASERAVAARTGLPMQPRERFWNALWARAPELASELDQAERALYGSTGGDAELLQAAERLHHVAYPVAERQRHRPSTTTKEAP